ncbi:MAG: PBP1A family penicillin-binding protein [Anaerolineaceae bacterium]
MGSVLIAFILWVFWDLPSIDAIPQSVNTPSIRIIDRYGKLLYEILEKDTGRNFVVPLDHIPKELRDATIATEDIHFYTNPGVDIAGIIRAVWINLRGGETLAGGSTITQQVARNLLLNSQERSIKRKIRESYLAWRISRRYTKDEIRALYLNQMYYGGLAYGVEAPSQTYVGKSVSELDLAESAMLAGMPQAPAIYNPLINFDEAKERQLTVLSLMQKVGFITPEQYNSAKNEPLVLTSTPYPIEAPHFVMMVKNELDRIVFKENSPINLKASGGLTVRTTLDLDWQHVAESAVAAQIARLKTSPDGLGHNVNSAALVSLDPVSGEILALVGSPDYFDTSISGAINMTLSPRQPGSALKPIVYAAALDPAQPHPWTAATMILDVSTSFTTHDGRAYTPSNYDGVEHGPVLVRQALASSLNIPAVITLNHIGLETLFNDTKKLGIDTLNDPNNADLSIALGGGAVRLLDLTAAYAAFANGGYQVIPQSIIEIKDQSGNLIYTPQPHQKIRVMDERVAWLISDILSDNDARTLGFGKNSILRLGFPAAVKTGTTTNFHDNWTVGYTPDLVTGVWAGNTDYKPMRDVTGLTGAAPIWHHFMRSVLSGAAEKSFTQPSGLVQMEICYLSGLLPTSACPYCRLEWFISGTQPTQFDTVYKSVPANSIQLNQMSDHTIQGNITVLDLPASARAWASTHGFILYSDLISSSTNNLAHDSENPYIYIANPAVNSRFVLTANAPESSQKININIASNTLFEKIELWMDGSRLTTFNKDPYEFWWTLSPGEHQVWAIGFSASGEATQAEPVSFSVQTLVQ